MTTGRQCLAFALGVIGGATLRSLVAALVFVLPLPAHSQDAVKHADVMVQGHVYEPEEIAAAQKRIDQLQLPDGFRISKFAEGLDNPRMIAVAKDGTVYVTQREPGNVVMLRDLDNDGRADVQKVVAEKPGAHGIALRDGKLYFATHKEVYAAEMNDDGSIGELKEIVSGLPDVGQHPNRTIAFGPDGMLYISVGSVANALILTIPKAQQCCAPIPTAASAKSTRRACAIPSDSIGIPRPENCLAWTTGLIGSETTSNAKS